MDTRDPPPSDGPFLWTLGTLEYFTLVAGILLLALVHLVGAQKDSYPPTVSKRVAIAAAAASGTATDALVVPKTQLRRAPSIPVNLPNKGVLGFGVASRVADVVRSGFLRSFLRRMYEEELARGQNWLDAGGGLRANSAVAHASSDPENDIMNIAMPDLTAEYWCTFVPAGHAPIFRLRFPRWARYAALTVYDVGGLPIASVNARQVHSDARCFPLPRDAIPAESELQNESEQNEEQRRGKWMTAHVQCEYVVNLMWGCATARWGESPLCALFRVYRPDGVSITPNGDLPRVRFVKNDRVDAEARLMELQMERAPQPPPVSSELFERPSDSIVAWDGVGYNSVGFSIEDSDLDDAIINEVCTGSSSVGSRDGGDRCGGTSSGRDSTKSSTSRSSFWATGAGGSGLYCENYLAQEGRSAAMANGRRIGKKFAEIISTKLKELDTVKFGVDGDGSQFFHPKNTGGLFKNANATYVAAFLPITKHVMRIRAAVPHCRVWRPFYGFMAVSYTTTKTIGSMIDSALGTSGTQFELFVAHSEEDARVYGGYRGTSEERLLLWKGAEQPGLVLRYLHYLNLSDGLTSTEVAEAIAEREHLMDLDGTRAALKDHNIPGIAEIRYF
jgi:hypothetical protein